MKNEVFNEQVIIIKVKDNDPHAFKLLYEKFAPRLHSFTSRFNFSHQESEEIIQETFIRIWQNRNIIDPHKPFNTFLISIAKNLIYNQIRHAKYVSNYANEFKVQSSESIDSSTQERELKQIINNALQLLPDRCREVFKRSRLEGYSNQEISNDLHISKSTVENQLNKGLKIMRSYLESHGVVYSLFFIWLYGQ